MVTAQTSLQELFELTVKALDEVEPGEVFRVRDLFCGVEWKRLDCGMRSRLGSKFFAYAQAGGAKSVELREKTAQNQQQYVKL